MLPQSISTFIIFKVDVEIKYDQLVMYALMSYWSAVKALPWKD